MVTPTPYIPFGCDQQGHLATGARQALPRPDDEFGDECDLPMNGADLLLAATAVAASWAIAWWVYAACRAVIGQ